MQAVLWLYASSILFSTTNLTITTLERKSNREHGAGGKSKELYRNVAAHNALVALNLIITPQPEPRLGRNQYDGFTRTKLEFGNRIRSFMDAGLPPDHPAGIPRQDLRHADNGPLCQYLLGIFFS